MAYKPPKQTIIDNDLKGVPSNEAVFEGLKLKLPKPSIDGTSGQLLSRGATADDTSWVNPPGGLPSGALEHQVLVYDGSAATWAYPGLGDGTLGTGNVILGRSKPTGLTTGTNNILVGNTTGNSLTTGYANVIIGSEISGFAVGSGSSLTTGYANTILGIGSGSYQQTGIGNTYIGTFAGYQGSSDNNTLIGYQAGQNTTTGAGNTFVGQFAGANVTTGSNNTIIGRLAGTGAQSDTTIIGAGTTQHIKIEPESVTIGTVASTSSFQTVSIGPNASVTGQGGVALGHSATAALVGTSLGRYTNSGVEALAAGHNAQAAGNYATAVGGQSLANGPYSTAVGGAARTGTGYNNVSVGVYSGFATTTGQDNLLLGYGAGQSITTGSGNTILGQIAGSATLANTVIVAAGATERFRVDSSGNMGIGTTTPAEKLEVSGNIKATSGDVIIATAGKGLAIKSGTNAKLGTAQFTAQTTVTVNTTAVTSNSLIFVTGQDGVDNYAVQNKVAGTSFEIHHNGGNVTALVAWMIVEATP